MWSVLFTDNSGLSLQMDPFYPWWALCPRVPLVRGVRGGLGRLCLSEKLTKERKQKTENLVFKMYNLTTEAGKRRTIERRISPTFIPDHAPPAPGPSRRPTNHEHTSLTVGRRSHASSDWSAIIARSEYDRAERHGTSLIHGRAADRPAHSATIYGRATSDDDPMSVTSRARWVVRALLNWRGEWAGDLTASRLTHRSAVERHTMTSADDDEKVAVFRRKCELRNYKNKKATNRLIQNRK